jgi:phosphoribosylaminoimidazole carboxylase (NCAIR synthetase)
MLKSRKEAYDGKGNAVARTEGQVEEAFRKLGENIRLRDFAMSFRHSYETSL